MSLKLIQKATGKTTRGFYDENNNLNSGYKFQIYRKDLIILNTFIFCYKLAHPARSQLFNSSRPKKLRVLYI